jgi:hypothetical protein
MAAGMYTMTIKRKGHQAVLTRSAFMFEAHAELLAQMNEALIEAIPHAMDAAIMRGGPVVGALHNATFLQTLLGHVFAKFAPRISLLLDIAETEAPFIRRVADTIEARERAS